MDWIGIRKHKVHGKQSEEHTRNESEEKHKDADTDARETQESYTYPDTKLRIYRSEDDSKLYIKDDFVGENSLYFFRHAQRSSQETLSAVPIEVANPKNVFVGSVMGHGDNPTYLLIFDLQPSLYGNLKYSRQDVIDFVEKPENEEFRKSLQSYIAVLGFLAKLGKETAKVDKLTIFINDGDLNISRYNKNDRVYIHTKIPHMNCIVENNTLTINFEPHEDLKFMSSGKPQVSHAKQANYLSVVTNFKEDDIYIGSFGYTLKDYNYRLDFFLGLTLENFYQYYRMSQRQPKKLNPLKLKKPKKHSPCQLFI